MPEPRDRRVHHRAIDLLPNDVSDTKQWLRLDSAKLLVGTGVRAAPFVRLCPYSYARARLSCKTAVQELASFAGIRLPMTVPKADMCRILSEHYAKVRYELRAQADAGGGRA